MDKSIYVDAAASLLKPESVVRAQTDFLKNRYANAGRGTCARAGAVDKMVADARQAVAKFIGANAEQIVFTSGTTDGLNRIANMLPKNSVVAVSDLDHHSARLPFEAKYKTVIAPLDKDFNYDAAAIPKCDAFVITAMSNVLGVGQNVGNIPGNPLTIVDAAQLIAHEKIDVVECGYDALVFSGHKMGADTGIGILYLKEPDKWQTDKFGGGQYQATGPARFEAGTLPLTQIAGLIAAIEDKGEKKKEKELLSYLRNEFSKIPRIKFISRPDAYVLTFIIKEMHPLDFGAMMGARGICLRVGNMCASWLHQRLGIDGSVRISVGPWNTIEEMKKIVRAVKEVIK